MCVCVCVCKVNQEYIYMCVCVYIYIYIYIYTVKYIKERSASIAFNRYRLLCLRLINTQVYMSAMSAVCLHLTKYLMTLICEETEFSEWLLPSSKNLFHL